MSYDRAARRLDDNRHGNGASVSVLDVEPDELDDEQDDSSDTDGPGADSGTGQPKRPRRKQKA